MDKLLLRNYDLGLFTRISAYSGIIGILLILFSLPLENKESKRFKFDTDNSWDRLKSYYRLTKPNSLIPGVILLTYSFFTFLFSLAIKGNKDSYPINFLHILLFFIIGTISFLIWYLSFPSQTDFSALKEDLIDEPLGYKLLRHLGIYFTYGSILAVSYFIFAVVLKSFLKRDVKLLPRQQLGFIGILIFVTGLNYSNWNIILDVFGLQRGLTGTFRRGFPTKIKHIGSIPRRVYYRWFIIK